MCPHRVKRRPTDTEHRGATAALSEFDGRWQDLEKPGIGCPYDLKYIKKQMAGDLSVAPPWWGAHLW